MAPGWAARYPGVCMTPGGAAWCLGGLHGARRGFMVPSQVAAATLFLCEAAEDDGEVAKQLGGLLEE